MNIILQLLQCGACMCLTHKNYLVYQLLPVRGKIKSVPEFEELGCLNCCPMGGKLHLKLNTDTETQGKHLAHHE